MHDLHATPREAVTVSLDDLKCSRVDFDTLEEAFGPSSLGIMIVKDLPPNFVSLRERLLSYASYLANLPSEELGGSLLAQQMCSPADALVSPSSHYLSGWSCGKEKLKTGHYDTLKGSYYVNCAFYNGQDLSKKVHPLSEQFPEFTAPNLWPDEGSLPGFKSTFEQLCTVIIDTAIVVAGLVDRYAEANIRDYERGYLERVVKSSIITKARLLHYFPPKPSEDRNDYDCSDTSPQTEDSSPDSWCATHIDHGCLTGLTAPVYVDESQERLTNHTAENVTPLRSLAQPPDASTGLYIQARDATIVKVSIPPDCLAFQTGEALQVITGGQLKAVPHFVKAGANNSLGASAVARNTLAVFTQPNLEDIVDPGKGTTFGEFSKHVMERFA